MKKIFSMRMTFKTNLASKVGKVKMSKCKEGNYSSNPLTSVCWILKAMYSFVTFVSMIQSLIK